MRTPLALLAAFLSVAPPPPPSPAPPASPSKPAAKPTPAPPPILQGVVKGPDGKPVEKALVLARSLAGRMGDPALTTRTDSAGAFRIPLKVSGPVTVRVEAKGLAAQTLERIQPTASLAVTLKKGGAIEGIVRDGTSGQPLPGARVEAYAESGMMRSPWEAGAGLIEAVANAKGAFRLEGLGAGAHTVSAAARGFGRAQRSSVVAGGRVELFLFPGASLSGVVRDPGDQPVPGAMVRVEGSARMGASWPAAQTTDAAGRFEFLGLGPNVYRVVAHHKDWALGLTPGVVVEQQGDVQVDLRLERGAKVTGRLVDTSERPVAGHVSMQELAGEPSRSAAELLRAEAGPDGRFILDRIPGGEHALAAESRGYAPKRVEVQVGAGGRGVDIGDVILETGAAIRGRVRDKAGLGIAPAHIWATSSRGGGGRWETETDTDGAFVLAGLQGSAYRLTARASGYASANVTANAGTENLEIVLEPAGSITGTVADDAGRIVEAFQANASPTGRDQGGIMMRGPGGTSTATDGRFTLYDLAAGEYVVEVTAPEKGRGVVSGVKVTAGATTDVGRLTLKAGGIVRGQVVDANGGAVPGANVTVGGTQDFWGPDRATGSTDASGAFEIRGVTPGPATATATHPNFAGGQATGLDVDPARPVEARIVLTQGGRIQGVARRRGNVPIAGANVHVMPERGGMQFGMTGQAITGPDGAFAIEHVAPGRVRATLMAREGASLLTSSQSREVEVQEGQTSTVEFLARDILVSGRVTRAAAPLPGVRLIARGNRIMMMSFGPPGANVPASAGPQRMTALTREDGSYEMLVDEPGQLRMLFESTDGRTLPFRMVEVPDADTATLDFDFAGILVAGQVLDKDTEQPVGGAMVSARLQKGGPGGTSQSVSGADGRFQLEVDAGDYRIAASKEGYGGANQEVSVGTSGVSDVRVLLSRGVSIRGKVLDVRGRPASGMEVSASAGERGGSGASGFARSLADGSFRIDGLEPRGYVLLAGSEAAAEYGLMGPVTPGDREVVVRLRPAGHVRVTVVGPEGAPMKDVYAHVTTVDGHLVGGSVGDGTDGMGIAELTTPAGNLEIEVTTRNLKGTASVAVQEGGTAATEIRLAEKPPPAGSP